MRLAQSRPGEWFIFSEAIPAPIPVSSWLIEQIPKEDRRFFLKELARIYGTGRRVGKAEGRDEIRNAFKELMLNDPTT